MVDRMLANGCTLCNDDGSPIPEHQSPKAPEPTASDPFDDEE